MARYTQLNHKQRIVNRYKSLFCLVITYLYSQEQYLDRRSAIQQSNSYQRLTQYNREFMRGMEEMFTSELYRNNLVFCYDYRGRRYAIDSAEYKLLSPKDIADHNTFCGHCYRADLSKCYYQDTSLDCMREEPKINKQDMVMVNRIRTAVMKECNNCKYQDGRYCSWWKEKRKELPPCQISKAEQDNQKHTKQCPHTKNDILCVQYPDDPGCGCDPCLECDVYLNGRTNHNVRSVK